MKNLHLFFSHKLTDEQIADAREHWGVSAFVPLPDDLQKMFSNVPPDFDAAGLRAYSEPLYAYIREYVHTGDCVLVQGDFGLTFLLVNFLIQHGAIPLYATTERASLDVKNPDGSITTQRIFRHKIFRKYA
jgi:hypothetical protein